METIILANALITNPRGEMLTVRKEGTKFYMMAGGKIEKEETPLKTLHRELLEELDLSILSYSPTLLGTHTTMAVNETNTLVTSTIFHIPIPDMDLQPKAEIEEVRWISKLDYNQFPLAHLLKEFSLPIWLKMKF